MSKTKNETLLVRAKNAAISQGTRDAGEASSIRNKRSNSALWWDVSWNPVTGCTPVSEGCAHCYAKEIYHRFYRYTSFDKVMLRPERLSKIDRSKPKVIFVDSASDLFHEEVPFGFISEVFSVMQRNPLHTFVVLTKRARRMVEYFRWASENNPEWWLFYPLENVWMGVTAENQDRANERIPLLLRTPARHRFVSVEPMLGEVDISEWAPATLEKNPVQVGARTNVSIELVICGGESGPGARVMRPEWARALHDQCVEAQVPFFFKQWGEWVPDMDEAVMVRSRSTGIGRKLDGVEWNELPWRKPTQPVSSERNDMQMMLEVDHGT